VSGNDGSVFVWQGGKNLEVFSRSKLGYYFLSHLVPFSEVFEGTFICRFIFNQCLLTGFKSCLLTLGHSTALNVCAWVRLRVLCFDLGPLASPTSA
jgi:hypothetical protein